MTDPNASTWVKDQRIEEIISSFLEACDAGWAPNRDQILAAYPDLKEQLEAFFENYDAVDAMVMPLRGDTIPDRSTRSPGDSTQRSFDGEITPGLSHSPGGSLQEGDRIGCYQIRSEIGRGGMGIVYQASRTDEPSSVIALKMILSGPFASPEEVQRFCFEAEVAAQMDHPHIVPIYEVGQQGEQHYFAMKWIEGSTLADLLPTLCRDLKETVRLLAIVAQTVHYAHQRGILHRDLKPGNILVDEQGKPWITDFGLAKRLTDSKGLTQSNAIMGSPNYMAPEQTEGSKVTLTTGVDTYALGAILYEALTGKPPFDSENVLETLSQLRQIPPVPPHVINEQVDRDLEHICLRCLRKNPEERYDSAEDLAKDLERWESGKRPMARPLTSHERFLQWLRKLWGYGSLLLVVMLLVLLGLEVEKDTTQEQTRLAHAEARHAKQAQKMAEAMASAEKAARARAELVLAEAHRQRAQHEQLYAVAIISHATAQLNAGKWEEAEHTLRQGIQLQPENAEAYRVLGDVLAAQNKTKEAISLYQQALKVRSSPKAYYGLGSLYAAAGAVERAVKSLQHAIDLDPKYARAFAKLGQVYARRGEMDQAIVSYRRALELEPNQPETWDALGMALAAERKDADAIAAYERAITLDSDLPHSWTHLGVAYYRQGNGAKAIESWNKALALNPGIAEAHYYLGLAAAQSGDFSQSIDRFKKAIKEKPDFAQSYIGLANLYLGQSDYAKALPLYQKAVATYRKTLGEAHPATAGALSNLAHVHRLRGDFDKALPLYQKALSIRKQSLGSLHPQTAQSLTDLATVYQDSGKDQQAVSLHREALRIQMQALGQQHPQLVRSYNNLGMALTALGKHEEALRAFENALRITRAIYSEKAYPKGHPTLVSSLNNLGSALMERGEELKAQKHFEKALNISRQLYAAKAFPQGHPSVAVAFNNLGAIYLEQLELDKAISFLDRAIKIQESLKGSKPFSGGATEGTLVLARPPLERFARSEPVPMASGEVTVWDATTGKSVLSMDTDAETWSVTFSPDGAKIAGSRGSTIQLWDAVTGRTIRALDGHNGSVYALAFSPDGKQIVSGSGDETIRVWDAETGQGELVLKGDKKPVQGVAVSPDGKLIAGGGKEAIIRIWDAQSGKEQLALKGNTGSWECVAFSPDGKRLLAAGEKSLKLWDMNSGMLQLTLKGHREPVTGAYFSPDGRRIVSGSRDKSVKVWDAITGEEILTLRGHTGAVTCAAFSPDGKRLASGGQDGSIKIWEAGTGQELLTFTPHAGAVRSVSFSPDGKRIVVGCERNQDGLIRFRGELSPLARTWFNLGAAYEAKRDYSQATMAYSKAIESSARFARAILARGNARIRLGDFQKAKEDFSSLLKIAPRRTLEHEQAGDRLRYCEDLLRLEPKLREIAEGDVRPEGERERVLMADFCRYKGRHLRAAQLYLKAIGDGSGQSGSPTDGLRYAVASMASLSLPELEPKDQSRWRMIALKSLQEDLQRLAQLGSKTAGPGQEGIRSHLRYGKIDPYLARLRDEAELRMLPESERKAWEQLWKSWDQVLQEL